MFGKTSTKDIIANVVSKKYKVLKTEGNNNNNIGLPFTILRLKDEEALVLEMGMNHLGEIELLSRIAKPTIGIIVNVGTAHIGNLGSRENILKAKLEILSGMKCKKIVVNNDNDMLHDWYKANKQNSNIEILTYGIENESTKVAKDIVLKEERCSYKTKIEGKEERVCMPITGEHFILNSLASIIIGEELGLNKEEIKSGIEGLELTKKRMDIYNVAGVKIINDAYNASFESIKAGFEILDNYENSRKIAVIGDMFELGEYSQEIHREVGKEFLKHKIDILICSGENSKYIIEEVKMNCNNMHYVENKLEIVEMLAKIVKPQDVILFKASNGMKFFELAEGLKERLEKSV